MITDQNGIITITERDDFGRDLIWTYDGTYYVRTASASLETGLGEHIKAVSEVSFARAYWRNWNRERFK